MPPALFMVTSLYKAYIASPKWKLKTEAYYKKNGRYCKACKVTKPLHVHHMTYERLGHERLGDLVSLCYTCHAEVHRLHRKTGRRVPLRTVTLQYIQTKLRSLR